MNKTDFIQFMDKHNNLKKDLFIRAFLLTDKQIEETNAFPFYGNWRVEEHCGYYFMAHKLAGMNVIEQNNAAFFILGHAYNPFTMEIDEKIILKRIADAYGTKDYIDRIDLIDFPFYTENRNGRFPSINKVEKNKVFGRDFIEQEMLPCMLNVEDNPIINNPPICFVWKPGCEL